MKKQISLYTAIQGEYELTDEDRQQIYNLLGYRCRRKTKDDIMGRLRYITAQPAWPLYERVIKKEFSDGTIKWTLCVGQDGDQQIIDTRDVFLGRC